MSATKNITVSLNMDEHEDLEFLIDYFQKQSISTVTRSDVMKYMISRFKQAIENDKMNELRSILDGK